jgi:hypothetical protein
VLQYLVPDSSPAQAKQSPYTTVLSLQGAVLPSAGFLFDMIRAFPSGWTDSHNNFQPSPPYSPEPTSSESTFPVQSLPDYVPSWNDDPLWSSTASFLYESPLVNVSLGRRVWDRRLPVYGFNGLVQGAVKLSRKCDHVVRVEVSVEKALIFN